MDIRTIPALLDHAAERFAAAEAIVELGDPSGGAERTVLTFGELRDEARATAAALIGAGIEPGDRVAIWAPNCWEWVVAALGICSAGGVVVPLNTRFKGAEAAYACNASRARLLFCANGFLGFDYVTMLRGCGEELPHLERIVILRGDEAPDTLSCDEFTNLGAGVDPAEVDRRAASVTPDAISDLIFTSGTTGRPKGVMVTHEQTLRTFESWSQIVGLREGDRYLIVNPFFHTFGYKAGALACLIRGATMVPFATFDVGAVLAAVAAERITMVPGPPTLFQTILDHPDRDRFDLSSLRLAVTGAAVIPVEMIERLRAEMTFETIITAYGLTESTGVVSMCRPEDDPVTIATTSGRAIPDVEMRTVDADGNPTPAGEPGEIVVRGYNVMQGYFENPEATAEAIDADGWLHTGDIGVLDERGYVRITDRLKDMFIVGGFNAYPAEIEGLLLRHPGISQVAVVGVPDERMGEVGRAFVVPRPGVTLDPAEIVAWARDQMANYKVPRSVEIVDALPLNASGKVLKYQLRS